MGEKAVFVIDLEKVKRRLITYKQSKYGNIFCQTNTKYAQAMSQYLDKLINQSKRYGEVNQIVIVKNEKLCGIASYDHVNNYLYISEGLIDPDEFKRIVKEDYFPSKKY